MNVNMLRATVVFACVLGSIHELRAQETEKTLIHREYDVNDFEMTAGELVGVLTNTLDPFSWQVNGGTGTVELLQEKLPSKILSVDQSQVLQEDIAGLLDSLRVIAKKPDEDLRPLAANGYWKDSEDAQRLRDALEKSVDFECEGISILDALAKLSKIGGLKISLADSPKTQARMAALPLISVMTFDRPVAEVLDLILTSLPLRYELVADEVIVVHASIRTHGPWPVIYPVDDLVQKEGLRTLQRNLQLAVTPHNWASDGGNAFIMPYGNDCIIINHTASGHRAIGIWLQSQRK